MSDDGKLSRWTLSTYQFNQDWTFTWLAEDLAPIRHQKLHWRSVEVCSCLFGICMLEHLHTCKRA